MRTAWDLVYVLYLVIYIVIILLGYWVYKKKKDKLALSIGLSFGILAVTHSISPFCHIRALLILIVIPRMLAYLIIAFSLYKVLVKR